MSARDDYGRIARYITGAPDPFEQELTAALDEIDRLRAIVQESSGVDQHARLVGAGDESAPTSAPFDPANPKVGDRFMWEGDPDEDECTVLAVDATYVHYRRHMFANGRWIDATPKDDRDYFAAHALPLKTADPGDTTEEGR